MNANAWRTGRKSNEGSGGHNPEKKAPNATGTVNYGSLLRTHNDIFGIKPGNHSGARKDKDAGALVKDDDDAGQVTLLMMQHTNSRTPLAFI